MNGNPWDRQRDPETGEPEKQRWFSRFDLDFRPLGPERTILAAYKNWLKRIGKARKRPPAQAPHGWYGAARRGRWFERAEAWDKYIATEARAAEEATLLERQRVQREREWNLSSKLEERIEQMLRFPLATVTRPEPDGSVTIVEPVKWSQRDIATFAKSMMDLGRMSSELETSRDVLDVHLGVKELLDALPPTLRETVRRHILETLQRRRAEGGVTGDGAPS